jgi:hypothetical protein
LQIVVKRLIIPLKSKRAVTYTDNERMDKMKQYMITGEMDKNMDETYTVHQHVGGGAYEAVFFGSHNEVSEWLNANGIKDYGYGF